MTDLVTLQQVKDQLGITHSYQDAFLEHKADEAVALVLAYLNYRVPAAPWTAETVPVEVRSVILSVVAHLYRHRGDDDEPDKGSTPWNGFPTPVMRGKLQPYRLPTIG